MQTPNPHRERRPQGDDQKDTGVRQPPVPPDQAPDVIPQRDPPRPGRREEPPKIA